MTRIDVALRIGPDGRVEDVSAAPDLPAALVDCVESNVATWRFEPAEEETTSTRFPFVFAR